MPAQPVVGLLSPGDMGHNVAIVPIAQHQGFVVELSQHIRKHKTGTA